MSRSTVVYTHGGGRLGNQLVRFLHWMAWARTHEQHVQVLNMAFWRFASLFARWREYPACVFTPRRGPLDTLGRLRAHLPASLRKLTESNYRLPRALHSLGRWLPGCQVIALDDVGGESLDLDDPEFIAGIRSYPVTVCGGWKIASWPLVERHQTELRYWFEPAPVRLVRARDFLDGIRSRHDLVVGLLIRQTDYRAWNDGRFYYSTGEYAEWIRQLVGLHPDKRVAVVIAADEWQDPVAFKGLPCYFAAGAVNVGGHWFDSFVTLSLCDFIASPPSTFSATAAFVGNKPLLPLADRQQILSVRQLLPDALLEAARHPVFGVAVK
jgi:hypothetical protein